MMLGVRACHGKLSFLYYIKSVCLCRIYQNQQLQKDPNKKNGVNAGKLKRDYKNKMRERGLRRKKISASQTKAIPRQCLALSELTANNQLWTDEERIGQQCVL